MTKDMTDLTALLDLLRQAIAIANRLRLGVLAYLLDLAVKEATEQIRILDRHSRPRT